MAIPPAGQENAKEKSPTAVGATDWHPDAYSPETGLVYIGSMDDYMGAWYDPNWEFHPDSYNNSIGGGKEHLSDPESGEKAARATAIDPRTGEIVWATPYDNEDEPFWPGGNTPTGGNLVFAGNNGGQFRALHAETGDVLWEEQFSQQFSASPVVWDDPVVDTQFVAVASASEMTVFSLVAEQETDTRTATPTETSTPAEPGSSETDDPSPTESQIKNDDDDGDDTTTESPGLGGFGFGTAGAGGAAWAAKRWYDRTTAEDSGSTDDDDGEENADEQN
jgi:hypothetical protein